MEKSRAMRIAENLPHDLWKEILNSAVYLHNRTPREAQLWKTPHEVFFSSTYVAGPKPVQTKPQLAHLRAYGCRAYAMTKEAQLKEKRLRKLDPRAHIGYLVGYDSTNIFRIWIPYRAKMTVISTRDVLFGEQTFFDGKSEVAAEAIPELDSLVARITLPEGHATNEGILEEEAFEPLPDLDSEDEEPAEDGVAAFDEKEDYEIAQALEEALLTPPQLEFDPEAAFHVRLPCETTEAREQAVCMACAQGVDESDDRFEDFSDMKISSVFKGAFIAVRQFRAHKRNLPPAPKTIRDLRGHQYEAEFRKAQLDHLESHRQMQSWYEVERRHAKGLQVIHSMWVFTYKTDKHGFLQKCKARLVICGNQ